MAEENPMLGLRGASRYYSEHYQDGFVLECLALRKVREDLGFNNLVVMVPFCRTLDSISLNPDSIVSTTRIVAATEQRLDSVSK